MKKNRLNSKLSQNSPPLEFSEGIRSSNVRLPSDYPPQTLQVQGVENFQKIYSLDVNLTIRLLVKEFTRKQATLLVGQAIFEILTEGITLGDWMVLEFLYSYLLGSKQDPLKVRNPKELELLLLLKVILLSGTWIGLEGKSKVPEDISQLCLLSRWVPNKRTYSSRRARYRMNKFLSVRIVPIDNLINRSDGNIRYSSYCKGYGESSSMDRHRKKTRISSEYDGEEVDFEKEEYGNIPLDLFPLIFQSNLLELKYRPKKK